MAIFKFYAEIEGWMSEAEIRQMVAVCIIQRTELYKEPKILEIGAWMGRTTVHLAQAGKVQTVDTFKGSDEEEHKRILAGKDSNWLYKQFEGNIMAAGLKDQILTFKGTSDDFFKQNKEKYRVILVDGSHEKYQVKKDIENSIAILEDDGALFIDDIDWVGVKEALAELRLANVGTTNGKLGVWWKPVSKE